MASQINVKLSLIDKFTKPLQIAQKGTDKFAAQLKSAEKVSSKFATSLSDKVFDGLKKVTLAAGAAATAVAGLAIKQGFTEAMDLEGYRLQLETATKDTQKAAEIMKYAINLANRTPFEAGELVQASTMMQAIGLDAQDYLTVVGDMAAAMNKDMSQATNAFIKAATTGEMEMMKEFGITKARINEYAKQTMGKEVIDASGKIKDQAEYQKVLVAFMQENFAGGMGKQATTMKGLWSTVTGVTKNALAGIVGITNEGTVKQGSAYDLLKQKIQVLADTLTKWQNDGTIDRISTMFTEGLTKAIDSVSTAFKWLEQNSSWLLPLAGTIAGIVVGLSALVKAVNFVTNAIKAVNVVINLTNIFITAIGAKTLLITGVIGIVIAAIVLLYTKCDWFRNAVNEIFGTIWEGAKAMYESFTSWITGIVDLIMKIPNALNSVKEGVLGVADKVGGFIGGAASKVGSWFMPHNALGTSYFKGGLTGINEHGGEAAVLPSGTQIIPADKTNKLLGGNKSINISVNISGNVIGNESYADYIGSVIARKLREAEVNMV